MVKSGPVGVSVYKRYGFLSSILSSFFHYRLLIRETDNNHRKYVNSAFGRDTDRIKFFIGYVFIVLFLFVMHVDVSYTYARRALLFKGIRENIVIYIS